MVVEIKLLSLSLTLYCPLPAEREAGRRQRAGGEQQRVDVETEEDS